MTKANFYAGFPQTPDELYDFPPQVIWKDEDPDVSSEDKVSIKLKISITEEKAWDIKVSTMKENLISFTLKHEYDEDQSLWNWKISKMDGIHAENLQKQSIQSIFNYCNDASVLLIGHATDEVKSRIRRRP